MFQIIQWEYVEKQCLFSKNQFLTFSHVLQGHDPEFDQSQPVEQSEEEYKENFFEPN